MREQHLSDEQWAELLLGEGDAEVTVHVAGCAECAAEQKRLRGTLASFRASAQAAAERPEAFWAWQREGIVARLRAGVRETRRLAWAGAMAVLILAAALLTREAPPPPATAQADPDDALLAEVERTVRRPVPAALEPAFLLTQELHRAALKSENGVKPQMNTDERR